MATTTVNPAEAEALREEPPKHTATIEQIIAETMRQDEVFRAQQAQFYASQRTFSHQQRLATMFARSGLFSDIKGNTEEQAISQALVKIMLGESMGFTPAESMQGIYVVNGRPAIGADLRAARMKRAGYDWDFVRLDDKGCVLRMKRNGETLCDTDGKPITVGFVEEDAQRAGLLAKNGSVYKSYPRNMYFARAITNAQRWHAPEVLGMSGLLTVEEAQELPPLAPEPPTIHPVQVGPSADKNRGHDAAAGGSIPERERPAQTKPKPEAKAEEWRIQFSLALGNARRDVGDSIFDAIMRERGYAKLSEIPSEEVARTILQSCADELEARNR